MGWEVSAGVGVCVVVGLIVGVRVGVGEGAALEVRGGMGVGVRAQIRERLSVVMVRVVGGLDYMSVCVCVRASEWITVCVSVRTCMRVAVCVHSCVRVCAVRVRAGASTVRCLSVPIGGAAVARGVVLGELWGLSERGDEKDSVQCCSGMLPVVRGSRRGRRSWMGLGGKTGEEEGWAWEGKGEMRHRVRGRRRTLQGIRLDIAPQRKVWRGEQNKGRGTHRGPGGSWRVVRDWEWPGERGCYCHHCNSPAPPGTAQTPLCLQQTLLLLLHT